MIYYSCGKKKKSRSFCLIVAFSPLPSLPILLPPSLPLALPPSLLLPTDAHPGWTMSDALGVFRQIDVNCNGDITLEEFQAWWEVRGRA